MPDLSDLPCPSCDGERTDPMSDAIPCSTCKGTGRDPGPVVIEGTATLVTASYIMASMPLSMLFAQDKVWQPKEGPPIALEAMGSRHRRNTLAWLRRNASRLAWAVVMESITGPLAARGEMAQDAEADWCEWMGEHPEEWLEGEPLVKRLAALVAADEARARAEAARPRTPEEMF